jgi:hypothetical protein
LAPGPVLAEAPRRARVVLRHFLDRGDEGDRVDLLAAELAWQEEAEQPRFLERRLEPVGHLALALDLVALSRKARGEGAHPLDGRSRFVGDWSFHPPRPCLPSSDL